MRIFSVLFQCRPDSVFILTIPLSCDTIKAGSQLGFDLNCNTI